MTVVVRSGVTNEQVQTISRWFDIPLINTPYGVFVDNTLDMPVWRVYRTLAAIRFLTMEWIDLVPNIEAEMPQILRQVFAGSAYRAQPSDHLPANDYYTIVQLVREDKEGWEMFIEHLPEFYIKRPAKRRRTAWISWGLAETINSGFSIRSTIKAIRRRKEKSQ